MGVSFKGVCKDYYKGSILELHKTVDDINPALPIIRDIPFVMLRHIRGLIRLEHGVELCYLPIGSYRTAFLRYLLFYIGDPNHKTS